MNLFYKSKRYERLFTSRIFNVIDLKSKIPIRFTAQFFIPLDAFQEIPSGSSKTLLNELAKMEDTSEGRK